MKPGIGRFLFSSSTVIVLIRGRLGDVVSMDGVAVSFVDR